jgi:sarcosine oxidase gamma subunit
VELEGDFESNRQVRVRVFGLNAEGALRAAIASELAVGDASGSRVAVPVAGHPMQVVLAG